MEKYFNIIKKSALFKGIDTNEINVVLNCLLAKQSKYTKDQFVFRSGEKISTVGMVLSGQVHIIKEDFWGNRTIIAEVSSGSLFGETYACVQAESLGVSVVASENTDILFMDIQRIMTVCTSACDFHTKLIHNLLSVLAEKNLMLTKKMEHISKRTTRDKLLSYLSSQSLKSGKPSFEIPFNRQQLADYLSVDRSAMSNELCKLRDEGILTFQKNSFHLEEKEI
ncbi:hypothetical protein SDC9_101166 [bioreactor metagenome]|uniref:Cyclic nucleotide-binding domain-containing protein n=1 Tax=bioreactor metagenome TaxID=1076179 RepID=A0A645ANP5_9ZZZZ|nr:Crp/Fnr family transcriptional regulator [Lachnospiraceae bacterium]